MTESRHAGLEIEDLRAHYGSGEVLRGVNLSTGPHELVCLFGPSGSGKTTLLRCVAGLHETMTGRVRLHGRDVTRLKPQHRRIGLVPQDSGLFTHLSVGSNVAYGLAGRPRPERRSRVAEMLALVGLEGLADRMPHQLSGGQQQRVALARALAPGPDLLLLDEPFSGLDPELREDLRRQVRAVLSRTGTPALLVSHDRVEALSIADRIAALDAGTIRQLGTPGELYRRPADCWVARLLGETVLLDGVSNGTSATTALGVLPHPRRPAGPVRVLLRPEQLRLRAVDGAGPPAQVRAMTYLGDSWRIVAELTSGEAVTVRLDDVGDHPPVELGGRVDISVLGPVVAFDRVGAGGHGTGEDDRTAGSNR